MLRFLALAVSRGPFHAGPAGVLVINCLTAVLLCAAGVALGWGHFEVAIAVGTVAFGAIVVALGCGVALLNASYLTPDCDDTAPESDLEDREDQRWAREENADRYRDLPNAPADVVVARSRYYNDAYARPDPAEQSSKLKATDAADIARSQYLAKISHEIRTPISGILGLGGLLENTPLSDEQRTHVRAITTSARNLKALVDEMLDSSKIEAGHVVLASVQVALLDTLHDAMALVYPAAENKGLSLSCSVAAETPVSLRGDPLRLRQIFLNLIDNAVKFTATGGVSVRLSPTGTANGNSVELLLEVRDTGPGLGTDDPESLFVAFAQAPQSALADVTGTGLGLSIVRELARAMGGDVVAADSEDGGALFSVTLKLGVDQDQRTFADCADFAHAQSLRAKSAPCIVRVDLDDDLEQKSVVDTLRASGMTTLEGKRLKHCRLRGGAERYVALLRHEPDLGKAEPQLTLTELRQAESGTWRQLLERPISPQALTAAIRGLLNPTEDLPSSAQAPHGDRSVDLRAIEMLPRSDFFARVLVAEDNPVNALLVMTILQRLGCDAVHVEDGASAVEMAIAPLLQGAASRSFDLILLDIRMPGQDGYSAIDAILEHYRRAECVAERPAIVALTANAFQEDRDRCLEAGFDDYISKPFEPDELRNLVLRWTSDTLGGQTVRRTPSLRLV